MGPSVTAKTKTLPSVTLTPTGSARGVKKRSSFGKGATPLRPIEAQSVVNIAGMKYLVVPHPDPGNGTFHCHDSVLTIVMTLSLIHI